MPTRVDYDYDVAKLGSDMVRLASHISELGAPTSRAVNRLIKRAAERAGVNPAVSAHWLRHAHLSHALGRGATVGEVRDTLGHANVAMTSAYLHASPDRSSGLVARRRHISLRRTAAPKMAAPDVIARPLRTRESAQAVMTHDLPEFFQACVRL